MERRLTSEQQGRLEQLVLEYPEARRFYVESMQQHASLRWSVAELDLLASVPPVPAPPRRVRRLYAFAFAAAAAALALAIGLGLRSTGRGAHPPAPFASLAELKACKWNSGTLPTEVGSRLGTGRLRLAEGLARIIFDHGAQITLEAPAYLELRSAQYCVLQEGRLIAKVPPAAVGFIVETPTAILNDLGTEFGVNVHEAGTSDVQVFRGLVDVRHRSSGRTEHMTTGDHRRFGADAVDDFGPLDEIPDATARPAIAESRGGRVVQISTALGRGKDAYVRRKYSMEHHSDILLLVKYAAATSPDYDRKAYIGIDLAALAGMKAVEARLSLTFAPTGMGFSSAAPDATFAIYGLTDEKLDDWDEQAIRWNNAPAANLSDGKSLDPSKVVPIGTFTIVQGELTGTRSVEGKALTDFVNADTNGLATFIVVRETRGRGGPDLVHGFANKKHPDLPPPTLRLTVEPATR